MLRINLGSGEFPLPDFINIDCEPRHKPDLVLDFTKEKLPYDDDSVDDVYMVHCLEHIEFYYWHNLLTEIVRVLKVNGNLLLSYPEFGECARRFLENEGNKKDFWRHTLYGRQMFETDYHVMPMHSKYIKEIIEASGFYRVSYGPEHETVPYNTVLTGKKDPSPCMREDIITKELHLARG